MLTSYSIHIYKIGNFISGNKCVILQMFAKVSAPGTDVNIYIYIYIQYI